MTRSRYILIGDVHGCLTELQALLCRIAPRPDDTLVFLGDLVDKGPESPGVVRWVRHLSTLYRVVLIEGNHSNRAASSKYTLFGMLVGCKPPRWLESMVPERANSVYGIYALTWELTSTEKGLSRAECFFSLKGLCIW